MKFARRAIAAAALGAGVLLAGCSNNVELMASMPESEANEVLAALQNAGIQAAKVPGKEGNVGISIPADRVGRAVDLLREKGLPRERFAGMGQVFRKEGLISSPLEERARYLYALSQELAATLNQIDGVIAARVHVVLPERSATGEAAVPSSAAVFIKHREDYNLDTLQPLIRRLVVNSIPGLNAEKVSIVLVSAQPQPPGGALPRDDAVPPRTPGPSGAATVAAAAAPGAATGRGLMTLAIVLALLLATSLGVLAFGARRYWWPHRKDKPASAQD